MKQNNPIIELLKWYVDSGIDVALENRPVNRLDLSTQSLSTKFDTTKSNKPPSQRKVQTTISSENILMSQDDTLKNAQINSAQANTLDDLRLAMENFNGCPLRETAKNLVFGSGNPNSKLMLVGEAPGAEEDRQGVPFVGKAGQLLDKMLASINMSREDVYITNLLPWRPPGNRTPTAAEIDALIPFAERHVELIAPKVLVFVGGTAAKAFLKSDQGIMKLRGKWLDYSMGYKKRPIHARAILHPAYLLRQPAQKRETWCDLIEIRTKLTQHK